MAATAGMNSVDGGGYQRHEATGDEEDDSETQEAERAMRGRRGFREISKILPVAIYIARPCRCDRVEQLGGTEMHNCVQLQQIGETEKFKSVAPRLKT